MKCELELRWKEANFGFKGPDPQEVLVVFSNYGICNCSPKGPSTDISDTQAPKYPYRKDLKAKVYHIGVHGPSEFHAWSTTV